MTSFYPDLFVRNLEHEFDFCVTKTPTSEETSCPICMEDITDKNKTTTACGHVFHSSCIFKNMMLRTSCPMCREDLICKSIPSSNTNANTNTNINININYNLSQNNSQLMESQLIGNQLMGSQLMDIDDDIINAMLSQELLSQELYYDEPSINNNNENETVNASDSDSDDNDSEYADSISDLHQELDNNSSRGLPTLADPDDVDYENDDFERFETDLTLSEVTNKMIELGYTQEDMFYYMTWRVNPFHFNMQYINKYNDEFYNTMTETMYRIFSKEIPITSNSEVEDNSPSMTIDELN